MSAQSSEQFDPSSAWRVAQGFLHLHGCSPDGEELSAALVQVLMIGVWAGCRFALLDHHLALAIAAFGNEQPGLAFEALDHGFASDFGESMQQFVRDALYHRGFTHAWAEFVDAAPDTLTASGALEEAEDLLRKLRDQSPDLREGSDE